MLTIRSGCSSLHSFSSSCMKMCDRTRYDTLNSTVSVYIYNCFLLGLQPDLLNFKKGWMVKLDEQGQVSLCFSVNNKQI